MTHFRISGGATITVFSHLYYMIYLSARVKKYFLSSFIVTF